MQWIVGLYQYDTTWDNPQYTIAHNDPAILTPSGGAEPNPLRRNGSINGHLEGESYAGFGQIDWAFAEAWTFTLGARYTEDKKKGSTRRGSSDACLDCDRRGRGELRSSARRSQLRGVGTPSNIDDATLRAVVNNPLLAPLVEGVAAAVLTRPRRSRSTSRRPPPGCVGCIQSPTDGGLRRNLEGDWDAVTGTLGLQWRPNSETKCTCATPRLQGGWLHRVGQMAPGVYADPEYLNSYELGWKQLLGGRFQFNTAAFFYDYKDFQAPLSVQLPGGTFFATQFLNLDAEVEGAGGRSRVVAGRPRQAVRERVIPASRNHAWLLLPGYDGPDRRRARRPGRGRRVRCADAGGNSLPNAPELKYTLGANYTWNWAPGSLTFGGTYPYTDDLQSNVFSNPIARADSNEIADFRLLWNDAKDRYSIIGFVKNAFDEEGYIRSTGSTPTAVGSRRTVGLLYPRTYGAEVQFRF